jgi:hypothetical protein
VLRVRVESRLGNTLTHLTSAQAVQFSVVRNAPGAVKLTVPRGTADGEILAALNSGYLAVPVPYAPGEEFYLFDDDQDTDTDEGGPVRPMEVAGRGILADLASARVYPMNHVPGEPVAGYRVPGFDFADATPGTIMTTLIARAQERGAIPRFTVGFTADHDSAGTPWPYVYTKSVPSGVDLLKVLTELTDGAWCDARMYGLRLDLYVPDSLAVDRPQAIMRTGKNVTTGPRKRSRANVRTVMLTSGDDKDVVESVDAAAVAKYGRREAFDTRSGIPDPAVVQELSDTALADLVSESETFTLAWIPQPGDPVAGLDFREGDWIRWDGRRLSTTALEPLRVNNIAWDYADPDLPVVSCELADQWIEASIARKRRLDALTQGSASPWAMPKINPLTDAVGPQNVDSLTATATVVFASTPAGGPPEAQPVVNVSWPAVTRNSDGTLYDDHRGYFVSYAVPANQSVWSAEDEVVAGPITITGLPWNTTVAVRIRVEDVHGNSSDFTYAVSVLTWQAYTAPAKPSLPAVSTKLGRVWVTWDGKTSTASSYAAPFAGVEVHTSSTPNFSPNDSTRIDFMAIAGTVVIPPASYSQPTYVKLVPIDTLNQRGTPSDQVSVTAAQLVSAEIADGSVTTAKLADLAVISAKIVSGAVNNAKIASMSAGAILAGTISSTITAVGRLRTAVSGGRVEVGGDGMAAYNASNQRTVYIQSTGDATFAGTITAALFTGTMQMNALSVTDQMMGLYPFPYSIYSGGGVMMDSGTGNSPEYAFLGAAAYAGSQSEDYTRGSVMQSEGVDVYGSGGSYGARRHASIEASFYSSASQVRIKTLTANANSTENPRRLSPLYPTHKMMGGSNPQLALATTNYLTKTDPVFGAGTSYWQTYNYLRVVGGAFECWTDNVDLTDTGATYFTPSGNPPGTIPLRAASFPTQSGSAVKEGIRDPIDSALEVILSNPAMLWRYRDGNVHEHIGPLADGLPDYLVEHLDDGRLFLDVGSEFGALWQACGELDALLTAAGV